MIGRTIGFSFELDASFARVSAYPLPMLPVCDLVYFNTGTLE